MRETTIQASHAYTTTQQWWTKALFLSIFLLFFFTATAQRPQYYITARLDTIANILEGRIDITYTNPSAFPMDKLGIHLWPNAYKTKTTALVEQMLYMDNMDLYGAKPEEIGGLAGLAFASDSVPILFKQDEKDIDVGWLILSAPLAPKEAIRISTPFRLKIPSAFSRMGVTGHAYQLTQWYPHLAVFDDEGWHMMPYLDYGEFFNDFADYEVQLEIPSSYTVAATGTLESRTDGERYDAWIFKAENVIDFAWFASPTFIHQQALVDVGSGKDVQLNIYYEPGDEGLWSEALANGQLALKHYSDWLGPYPYPQMSVVSSPLGIGGGMEYPMVAHIGPVSSAPELELLIAHEIGHTWLYGILANNERKNPWMDEGLNSFVENEYGKLYLPDYEEDNLPTAFTTKGSMRGYDVLNRTSRFKLTLQPPQSDPRFQRGTQYFSSAYYLPAQGLAIMQSMLGADMMKQMFRNYYSEYKFQHVSPAQLRKSFESTCECDLHWFFEEWINHVHEVDYRIEKFDVKEKEVTIVNHGTVKVPVRINTYKDGQPILDRWIAGFDNEKIIHLDTRADEVHLYEDFMGINKIRTANVRPFNILPRIGLLPKAESYDATTLGITPMFGFNLADGFMPGVAFSSGLIPQQRFKFVIAPMYGLESQKIRGFANFRYINDLKEGPFDKYLLSFGIDHFGYKLDTHYLYRDAFLKWEPMLALRMRLNQTNQHITQWWKYRFVHIDQFFGRGINFEEGLYEEDTRNYGVHELSWQLRSDYILRPFEALANVQVGQGFVRLNLNYKQHFAGRNKHLGTWIRGYAGWLPVLDRPEANVFFTINGQSSVGYFARDYMFDQWLGGRSEEGGFFAHQVFEKDAHLKTLANHGIGDSWMFGAGVSQAFPFRFLHFYMDATLYGSAFTEQVEFSYSGGAAIVLVKDVFEIFLPILESKDIRESTAYEVRDLWFERVTFTANIKLANPVNFIDRSELGF